MDIPLEALTTFSYDGKVVVRGQEFLARSAADAKLLTHPGIAKAKFAAHSPLAASLDVDEKPKRKYKRRDLTAEAE